MQSLNYIVHFGAVLFTSLPFPWKLYKSQKLATSQVGVMCHLLAHHQMACCTSYSTSIINSPMRLQHGFALLQIQSIFRKCRLFQTRLSGGMVVPLEYANMHFAMYGSEQGKQRWKAKRVRHLLSIPAKVQVFHNLGQKLRPERVRLGDWLDILHNQQSPGFDTWKPKKDSLGHVLGYVRSVVHDNLQRRCIRAFHFLLPNRI